MSKKLTIEFIRKSFEKENYKLISKEYINANKYKLKYTCPEGHSHSILWSSWSQGHKCPYCAKRIKYSIKIINKLLTKDGYFLITPLEYKNAQTKLTLQCPKGHIYTNSWNNWVSGKRCNQCYKIQRQHTKIIERNIPLYDTYSHQIDFCEETRRDPNDLNLLQIRCKKCNKWFTPTRVQVRHRVDSLKNSSNSAQEANFYCSDECKGACPIFKKQKYSVEEKRSKTNSNFTSEELSIWSQEVIKRANYVCEYCEAIATDAHHIQPKKLEPFFALDPDNGIACCEACHNKYAHEGKCSTGALAKIVCKQFL